jgi:hypothetical protein
MEITNESLELGMLRVFLTIVVYRVIVGSLVTSVTVLHV